MAQFNPSALQKYINRKDRTTPFFLQDVVKNLRSLTQHSATSKRVRHKATQFYFKVRPVQARQHC